MSAAQPLPFCHMADPTLGDWELPTGAASIRLCGEPAIAVVTFGCPHEHVDQIAACAGCAAEVQRCGDELYCRKCEDGPQPHECPETYQIRWLTGPRSATP